MKPNIFLSSSLCIGVFTAVCLLPVTAVAEDDVDVSSSTVMVDNVKIEIRVNKSTIETLKFPELSEDHMADAFLAGAFEPTAAGEAEVVNEVRQGVNDNSLGYVGKTESDELNFKRAQDKEAAAAASQSKFDARDSGNVTGASDLSISTR